MASIPRPGSLKFVEDFTRAFGVAPEYHSAGGYACGQVLGQAVEQAGSFDNEAIRYTILNGSFKTVLGTLGFDPDGLPSGTFPVVQWQDNSPEIVYPDGILSKPAIFD